MKKWMICLLVTVVAAGSLKAQDDVPGGGGGFDKSKLFFGGNFGLSFGDYTLVNVSPQIGYRFNRYVAAGGGVNFIYSSIKYRYSDPSLDNRQSQGVAGLNIFGRLYPIEYVMVQLQPELNYTWGNMKYINQGTSYKLDNMFVPSLLGGVGGAIPAGRGAFIVMVEYDLLQNARSPYGKNAFVNLGFNIGF